MKNRSIVIVDDNNNILKVLTLLLKPLFDEVCTLSSPKTLLSVIREKRPAIVLLDMNFSLGLNNGNEGLFWLSEIVQHYPTIPVVVFTAYAEIELAIESLKNGASDFVIKPWDNTKLIKTLESALAKSKHESDYTKADSKLTNNDDICWGTSVAMLKLRDLIEKVARTDANIFITGENGTGKEVIANMIHQLSTRVHENMVKVDMGAVTETLFESEMFGHKKGSFTDAKTDRIGKIEAANKGTLFLDEIGNLSYTNQAKLLSVVQSRQITRIGENTPVNINIRLISATNKNLAEAVRREEFREDLLYRINTIQIDAPPLRDREEDIVLLTDFFLEQYSQKYNKGNLSINEKGREKIASYSWPGNVRELKHTIEKAVILSNSQVLQEYDFQIDSTPNPLHEPVNSLDSMEKEFIKKAMKKHNNNISAVSSELGITRPTLYSKLKKYNI